MNADLIECVQLQGENLEKAVFDNADLSWANLVETNLTGASLMKAKLRNALMYKAHLKDSKLYLADLSEASLSDGELQGATLREANLRGATLNRAKLKGANLYKTTLTEADLQDADLTDVTGLLSNQLAGANLSAAKLPEAVAKFDALERVSERSQITKRLLASLLLGCFYALLTVATTTDVRLLTNSASSPLPVIQTQIPIAGFYFAAPMILVGLYFYFLIYMQRSWESLAKLPAVFPDGTPLDEKVYPSLLNGLVRAHFTLLKKDRPPFCRLQAFISRVLVYWVVPITLVFVWGRYLLRHEWWGTGIHAALLVFAISGALLLHRLATHTLQGKEPVRFTWKTSLTDRCTYQPLALLALWGALSYGAIEGHHPHPDLEIDRVSEATRGLSPVSPTVWVPQLFNVIGYAPYLDLANQDLSTKPPNWGVGTAKELQEQIKLVTGAQLQGANLQYALAASAFLGRADLLDANLQGAELRSAELQWAVLRSANLQGADLIDANLIDADLRGANLREADLIDANLQGAKLQEADLTVANLQGADFRSLVRETKGLEPDQVQRTENWDLAYYDDDFLPKLGLPPDHNETLPQKLEELAEKARAAGKE